MECHRKNQMGLADIILQLPVRIVASLPRDLDLSNPAHHWTASIELNASMFHNVSCCELRTLTRAPA